MNFTNREEIGEEADRGIGEQSLLIHNLVTLDHN